MTSGELPLVRGIDCGQHY